MNINSEENPLVSVITVTYQKLNYIYQTIDSIIMQDYSNIELIISDDGSSNFNANSILEYINNNKKDNIKNITVLHNKYNVGTVQNMNNAISHSKGEIICNLPGDDQFENNHAIKYIVTEMLKRKCHLLVTGAILCKDDLTPICIYPSKRYWSHIYKLNTPHKQYSKHIVGMDYAMAPGNMWSYTRKIYNKMDGFDEQYLLYEDGPFIAKLTSKGYMIDINYGIVTRLIRVGGVSSNPNNIKMKQDIKKYHENFLGNYDTIDNYFEKNRIKFWYKTLLTDSFLKKISICLIHPIYTFEYIFYSFTKNRK